MIPLIPALVLAFVSFVSSVFVLLYVILPILPPHPLSGRVVPAEFGLPNFRSLSPTDKCLIWLSSLDLLAVAIFVWQTINETVGGGDTNDPASSVRMWLVMTIRQTCLLIIASVTLVNLRMRRPTSFGDKQWMIWAPTLLLVVVSTTLAGVIYATRVKSLFAGLIAYSSTIAVISTVTFGCLVGTLLAIKRNIAALNEDMELWPPTRMMAAKPNPSFTTEEIDAIRDGASWITSNASSPRNSMSTWSFSTHDTTASSRRGSGSSCPQADSHPSFPTKSSSFLTPNHDNVPPVPPLPSPYGPLTLANETLIESDSFRRDIPIPPCGRFGLLTSTNESSSTLSAWSCPTTHHEISTKDSSTPELCSEVTRPVIPALANAQVLGGYGYAPGSFVAEKGLAAPATPSGTQIHILFLRSCAWLAIVWVPLGLSLPYLIMSLQNNPVTMVASVLLILSVTLSSPLLVLSVLFAPFRTPSGLFENSVDLSGVQRSLP